MEPRRDPALSLRPYQEEGVEQLVRRRRLLLGDEMGLGKTVQIVEALRRLQPEYTLILCPNLYVWEKTIADWWPAAHVVPVYGTATRRDECWDDVQDGKCNVYLITQQSFYRDHETITTTWDALVIDECHKVKNRKSKTFKALQPIVRKCEYFFPVTGTPISRDGGDIWALLHMIDWRRFSSYWRFVKLFCEVDATPFGTKVGETIRPEALGDVCAPYVLRRLKESVAKDLPPKTVQPVWLDLESSTRKEYERVRKQMLAEVQGQTITMQTAGAQLAYLQMIATHETLLLKDCDEPLSGPKVDFILEMLADYPDEPLIILSRYRRAIMRLSKTLDIHEIKHRLVVGGQSKTSRDQAVDELQSGKLRALLMTIQAGGVSLTLTKSRVAIFMNKLWTPAQNEQAQDRIHRIGQTKNVHIFDLVSKNTMEERLERVLSRRTNVHLRALARMQAGGDTSDVPDDVYGLLSELLEEDSNTL